MVAKFLNSVILVAIVRSSCLSGSSNITPAITDESNSLLFYSFSVWEVFNNKCLDTVLTCVLSG